MTPLSYPSSPFCRSMQTTKRSREKYLETKDAKDQYHRRGRASHPHCPGISYLGARRGISTYLPYIACGDIRIIIQYTKNGGIIITLPRMSASNLPFGPSRSFPSWPCPAMRVYLGHLRFPGLPSFPPLPLPPFPFVIYPVWLSGTLLPTLSTYLEVLTS